MTTNLNYGFCIVLAIISTDCCGIESFDAKDFGVKKEMTFSFLQSVACGDALLVCQLKKSTSNNYTDRYFASDFKTILKGPDQLADRITIYASNTKLLDGVYLIPIKIIRAHLGRNNEPKKIKWKKVSVGSYIVKLKGFSDSLIEKFRSSKGNVWRHNFWRKICKKNPLILNATLVPIQIVKKKSVTNGGVFGEEERKGLSEQMPVMVDLTLINSSNDTIIISDRALMSVSVIAVNKKGYFERSFSRNTFSNFHGKISTLSDAADPDLPSVVCKWIEIPPGDKYSWKITSWKNRRANFHRPGEYEIFPVFTGWSGIASTKGSVIMPLAFIGTIIGEKTNLSVNKEKSK